MIFLIVRGVKIRGGKKYPGYFGTGMIIPGCLPGIPSVMIFTIFIGMINSAGKIAGFFAKLI